MPTTMTAATETHSEHFSTTSPIREIKKYYDYETKDFITALHYFCRSGSMKIEDIKTVIKLHPQLVSHATPNGGDTPLHFAVAADDLQATRLLLEADPTTAIIKSSRKGYFGDQMTPLHVAIISRSSADVINALVRASPKSIRIRDGKGQSVHDLAYKYFTDGNSLSSCLDILRNAEHRALRRTNSISGINMSQLLESSSKHFTKQERSNRRPRTFWSPQA